MVTVRIPDDLRDRIDAARPSVVAREAWVRAACEEKLSRTLESGATTGTAERAAPASVANVPEGDLDRDVPVP